MTVTPPSSPRAKQQRQRPFRSRSFGGVVGGTVGFVAMSSLAGLLIAAAATPVVAVTSTAADSTIEIFNNLPEYVSIGELAKPSTYYAWNGTENVPFATFYNEDRVERSFADISPYVRDAAVAGEDATFYEHTGVNVKALVRAVITNGLTNTVGGASTITMQYVKNLRVQQETADIIDPVEKQEVASQVTRQTPERKLKEIKLAVGLEKKYSKEQILEGYLNIAYFGRQLYGIESAAQYYYGKSSSDVSPAEAASLIAIVKDPNRLQLDIEENLPKNQERRDWILGQMLEKGKLTQAQYDEAVATPIQPVITPKPSGCSQASSGLGYFCNFVSLTILNDPSFGKDAKERWYNFQRGGLKVYTTIDLRLQEAAVATMNENIQPLYDGINAGSAAVSTEVGTGKIRAMTQSRPFSEDPAVLEADPAYTAVNWNTDYAYGGSTGFQVGSTYKSFTMAEWIRTGHSVNEIVNTSGRTVQMSSFKDRCKPGGVAGNEPFTFGNAVRSMGGNNTALYAMAYSLNGGFVSMAQKLDICDVTELAESMGVHRAADRSVTDPDNTLGQNDRGNRLEGNLASVFAGTDEISPLTMALAYGGFLGNGTVCTPSPIDSIKNTLDEDQPFTKATCHQAIEPRVAAGVAYTLKNNVTNGIARHAASAFGIEHAAKTGTTDNTEHTWTVGGSTKISTAVWTGNVSGHVDTIPFGLPEAGKRVFPGVMNTADQLYGGDPFPVPDLGSIKVKTVGVPATAGKSFDETKTLLESLGFIVADGGVTDSDQAEGSVARTEPSAGAAAPIGSNVTVYRSNQTMIAVPSSNESLTYSQIVALIRNAGFTKTPVAACSGSGSMPKDENQRAVVSVSPGPGELARRDATITLVVECR